jgi:RNA polymerase sigma factor (sigma-70 family)
MQKIEAILILFLIYLVSLAITFQVRQNYLIKNPQFSNLQYHNRITSKSAGKEMFNPFLRQRKLNNRWYEPSLAKFFEFVDTQHLLTPEQETQYGKAIKMWLYVESIKQKLQKELGPYQNVTMEQLTKELGCSELTLLKITKYAETARYKMINCNMKLVLSIVSRYRKHNIPNFELISVGVCGLEKAVLKYDYARGFRFATYATWYIHQQISEYLRWQKSQIKLSGRYVILVRKIKQICGEYKNEFHCLPSLSFLATNLNITEVEARRIISTQIPAVFTSAPLTESKNMKMISDLIVSNRPAPDKKHMSFQPRHTVEYLMQRHLTYLERDILRMRYGLDTGGKGMLLRDAGERYGINWKELRKAEKTAIQKLATCEEVIVSSAHAMAAAGNSPSINEFALDAFSYN